VTVYLPRSAWTTTARGGSTLTGTKLIGCSIHYPASSTPINATNQEQIAERIRAWRNYHVNVRGWSDIGYQVGGDQAGRVWDLRGIDRVPAATASQDNPDANHEWGAFLFMIGNSEQPSPALIEAYRDWRHTRWLTRWPGRTQIRGHGQVPGASTECPGARTRALIADGTLAQPPGSGDDMTPEQANQLASIFNAVARLEGSGDGSGSVEWRVWNNTGPGGRGPAVRTQLGTIESDVKTLLTQGGVDIDALAAAIVAKLPPASSADLATVKQGVREVLLEGVTLPPS
jgi:hypothetical protein